MLLNKIVTTKEKHYQQNKNINNSFNENRQPIKLNYLNPVHKIKNKNYNDFILS